MSKKKYNNKSRCVSDWTTEYLKKRAVSLHQVIYVVDCYASHDMQEYVAVTSELESRGYEVNSHGSLIIQKA